MAAVATAVDDVSRYQKKWEELITDMLTRQREMVDTQYRAGLKTLEEMFRVGQAKSPQEIQQRVMELYRASFESLRQLSESQAKDFKAVLDRWTELMTKAA
jgi:predicted nuclease with TOPRIM domain